MTDKLDGQMSIFDFPEYLPSRPFRIRNKIRLIELFAGIGSQAMALRNIGANFEHYRVVEFDKYAIASYNAIHGTDFPTMDVTKIKGEDLGITDTDKYTYLLTYSFPCTDLSVAGKMLGMEEGSGTRSSLLWEVKRLLEECDELPQVLVMENVPQVHSKANIPHFEKWLNYLSSKGYKTYWQDMNAKEHGVAQSRNRTIAVSILGNFTYIFPLKHPLKKSIKDYLVDQAEEKYYVKTEKARELIDKLIKGGKLDDKFEQYKNPNANYKPFDKAISYPLTSQDFVRTGFNEIAPTLAARDYKDPKIICEMDRLGNVYDEKYGTGFGGGVWNDNGIAPTLKTGASASQQHIVEVRRIKGE